MFLAYWIQRFFVAVASYTLIIDNVQKVNTKVLKKGILVIYLQISSIDKLQDVDTRNKQTKKVCCKRQ